VGENFEPNGTGLPKHVVGPLPSSEIQLVRSEKAEPGHQTVYARLWQFVRGPNLSYLP